MAARSAKQKAALRKAQLASARKRKGRGRSKKAKIARAAVAVGVAYGAIKTGQYANRKVKKYQRIVRRDREIAQDRDWRNRTNKLVSYRQNLARHRANTRGLPSGSQKAKGTAWSYNWARR